MNNAPASIFLCGCGWLGKYAVAAWQGRYNIRATTRDTEKVAMLNAQGIKAHRFTLGDDVSTLLTLANGSTMILNIPAGRRTVSHSDYVRRMCQLLDALSQQGPSHLIFVSTTSVYGENATGEVTENSPLLPETPSAKANAEVEAYLQSHYQKPFTILRLAGLIGPDRHPIYSLQGRQLTHPERRINLIHVADVVWALERLHIMGGANNSLHLCCHEHPQRQDFYLWAAQQKGLSPPVFLPSQERAQGKYVNAQMTWSYLQLQPTYPSPFAM